MPKCAECGQAWLRSMLKGGLVALAGLAAVASPAGTVSEAGAPQSALRLLGRLPLLFVPEQGPSVETTGYAVRGREASVWVTGRGLTYRLHSADGLETDTRSWVVALDLVGATPRRPVGEDRLPTRVSFFHGPRPQWRTGLPSYASVVLREPWAGVDLLVSGTSGELETTFVVRPGADPAAIRLAYRGASSVRLGPDGTLDVDTPLGSIREQAPFAYQEVDGRRVEVAAAFELEPGGEPGLQAYRFRLGDYDPARELVIDPVTLVYCGYIGGSGDDRGYAVAVDAAGSAYVTGTTTSTQMTFPVTVGPDVSHNSGSDVFVAKLNAAGTALEYCGYIGGIGNEIGYGIAVDSDGNAYVTGDTNSNQLSFPVIVGPDLDYNGSTADAFVAKVNAAGTALDYCGYIGGSLVDRAYGIAVDTAGRAYVTGGTTSDNLPVAVGPDLSSNGNYDAFVARVNAGGTALEYCGYIGGSAQDVGYGVAVDGSGNAYVAGLTASSEATFPVTVGPDLEYNGSSAGDAFVAKVTASGSALAYCGYIGGTDSDAATGVVVDAAGSASVVGYTISNQDSFPVAVGPDLSHNGATDAFVARVNAGGTALASCGYIGGSGNDYGRAISRDSNGAVYVTGYTKSDETTFPVAGGPDLTYNGGVSLGDAFIAEVGAAATGLEYCGYIGGSGDEAGWGIAVDGVGKAIVVGYTASTEATFPVTVGPDLTHNGGTNDAFVAKVDASDFTLEVVPASWEICAGSTAEYTVNLGVIGGFSGEVTLEASGQPAGATADFSVNPVTPPGSSLLTIANTGGASGGGYTITVAGRAAGGLEHTADVALDVDVPPPPPTLTAPPNGATGVPLQPLFQWSAATGADSYGLEVDDDPAFATPEISVTGIGATSYATPADLQDSTTYHWRVRSENLCGTGVPSAVYSFSTVASCTYSISPTSQSFPSGGGTGSVTVVTQAGCDWTAVSNDAWIVVTGGASGTGNGTVSYTVAANDTGAPRTGTMTIAGETFTVMQELNCEYSILPTSQSFPTTGGADTVAVTAQAGCDWTAVSNDAWIAVTGGASGSGNGTVSYSVAANMTASPRTGTMTIAGATFTVTQAAGCMYVITPSSASYPAGGGTGSVGLATQDGCDWTAVSNDAWIAVTGGASGSGNGTVSYSVAANGTGAPRTGTISIATETFTVTQVGDALLIFSDGFETGDVSQWSSAVPDDPGRGASSRVDE